MIISYNWLKEYFDFDISPDDVAERLTHTGLEVESVHAFESVKGGLAGLTIGLVTAVEKHPDADKLSVTKVSVGKGEDLQIVCGASNVQAGQKVVVAQHGDLLYPFSGEPFKIKKTKIRGIASEGMICAEDEIGWSNNHDGIMVLDPQAPLGSPVREYLKVLNDNVIEIGLTPNRGDAMSHIGTARDLVSALSVRHGRNIPLRIPSVDSFAVAAHTHPVEVTVESTEGCSRFSGCTITGIEVKESPEWLKNRLSVIGLRSINNIVDIANFVMHECGQPLHTYDLSAVEGRSIVVKTLPNDTSFTTLDDKQIKLRDTDLMVCCCDGINGEPIPMCIAGVYGGLHSGVNAKTTDIYLEAACWNPKWIRKTASFHNLRTDAAMRFEKGVDPNGNIYALKRAAMLIVELAGGTISSEITDIYPLPVKPRQISLVWEKLNRIAGIIISPQTAKDILQSLSFEIISDTGTEVMVAAPTAKSDVLRSEDVIEEILRIYGYDKIPVPEALRSSLSFSIDDRKERLTEELSQQLASIGFREMMNNSITNSKYHHTLLADSKNLPVQLLSYSNTGLDSMRTSMLFPAMEVIQYNHNRKQHDLKLFEFGKTYAKANGQYTESASLALLLTGSLSKLSWTVKEQFADTFYLKGVMEGIFKKCGIRKYAAKLFSDETWQEAVTWSIGNSELAIFGKVNQKVTSYFDVKGNVYYAAIDVDAIMKHAANTAKFTALQKFPSVRRDLALVIDEVVSFQEIEQIAYAHSGNLLKEVNLFDVYADEKLGAGKKSYAVSFLLRDEQKTLTDADIDKVMDQVVQQFQSKLNAHIRK
jgi:phenylalanyl-tRNA synthetase beta chain